MPGWLIVVDRLSDLPAAAAGLPTMTTRDYIMQPRATGRQALKVLNLSRSYAYQTPRLLRLAARRGARSQGPADGSDRARARPAQLLRLRAGRARGDLEPDDPPPRRSAHRVVPAPGLPRPRRRPALRPLRPAAVRLVSLPDPGGVGAGGRRLARAQDRTRGDQRAGCGRQGRARGRDRRPMSASPGSRRGPRRRRASRSPSSSTPRSSFRPRTSRPSATSRGSPSPWASAWR